MKKTKKFLFALPIVGAMSILPSTLPTMVSCAETKASIAIAETEKEQKAMSTGLAIYSFDFKGNTLPDSRRFVNIQLTEISIQSDSEVKSIGVLNVIGKDDIVIHDDGHFDVPITFIHPENFSGETTVKFQLKFRYRLSGTNVDEIVEDLVIKYFNSTPAPSDTAMFELNGQPTYNDMGSALAISVPIKFTKDKNGYPYEWPQIKSVTCSNTHIIVGTTFFGDISEMFTLLLKCNYVPPMDTSFNFNLYFTYENVDGDAKTVSLNNVSFDYHAPVVTQGQLNMYSPDTPQLVGSSFDVHYTYIDSTVTSYSIPLSNPILFDPDTGAPVDGIKCTCGPMALQSPNQTWPVDINVSITDPTKQMLDVSFGLCININGNKCVSDKNFTFTYIPVQP